MVGQYFIAYGQRQAFNQILVQHIENQFNSPTTFGSDVTIRFYLEKEASDCPPFVILIRFSL